MWRPWQIQLPDKDDWMLTFTGKQVWPLRMRAEDICLVDIAHSLALKCRFTGHTRFFYSVAQHSVLVARELIPELEMWGLLHDAGEAYLPDVCAHIKHRFPLLIKAEDRILDAIRERFDLPRLSAEDQAEIKRIDRLLVYWEGRALMPMGHGSEWDKKPSSDCIWVVSWPPAVAESRFLKQAKRLLGGK